MKVNTVCISIEEYNELIHFKRTISENNSFIIRSHDPFHITKYISNDEAVSVIATMNNRLQCRIEELEQMKEPKYVSKFDLKRMSIWQFIKWRRNNG